MRAAAPPFRSNKSCTCIVSLPLRGCSYSQYPRDRRTVAPDARAWPAGASAAGLLASTAAVEWCRLIREYRVDVPLRRLQMSAPAATMRTYNPTSGKDCVAPSFAADLDCLDGHIVAVLDSARALASGLSDGQFNWKPSPSQWSVAQCLRHLVLTGTFAANGQDAAISG